MAEERERGRWLPSAAVVFMVFSIFGARAYWSQQPDEWRASVANHAWQAAMVTGILFVWALLVALALGALRLVVRVIRSAWTS